MSLKKFVLLAGAAVGLGSVSTAMAQEQVSTSNNDETRAVVAEMLSDASNRSSLLPAAGHDAKGFMISGEGFTLRVGGMLQFRYLMNWRDDNNTAGIRAGDDFEPGF